MQVPSWVAAWEADVELHQKVQTLHEVPWFSVTTLGCPSTAWQDLQSAIGAQHEAAGLAYSQHTSTNKRSHRQPANCEELAI